MFDLIGLLFVGLLSVYILLRPLLSKKTTKSTGGCGSGACDTCGACSRIQQTLDHPSSGTINPKTNP
jgi:hypothetical protein